MNSRPVAARAARACLAVAAVAGTLIGLPATSSQAAPAPSSTSVKAELDKAVEALQAAEAVEGAVDTRAEKLGVQMAQTQAGLELLQVQLHARARFAYTTGVSDDVLVTMLTSDDPTATVDRLGLLGAVSRRADAALDAAVVANHRLAEQQAELATLKAKAAEVSADLAARNTTLTALLARAQAAEAAAAEAARQAAAAQAAREAAAARAQLAAARTAQAETLARAAAERAASRSAAAATASRDTRSVVRGSYACPVGSNHSFTDTYGAPRSGGRSHEGVDVFAPYGSPAYAVESGVIVKAYSNSLGGLAIILRGNSGDEYYYAHQERNTVSSGQRVSAGEQIGTVGTSGNAAGTAPHVHFELWPGGGNAVNPTEFVRRAC